MTEQERELLNNLLSSLDATSTGQKDMEAEQMINRALARKPDATYLLVQRTLLQEIALKSAQSQIDTLEQQLRKTQSTSFSGVSNSESFLGTDWRHSTPPSSWEQSLPPNQGNIQPVPPMIPQPSAFSGFLRSAAATAAGIAGGTLLFQGLENLFNHHDGYQGQQVEDLIEPPPIANDYENINQDNFYPNDSNQFIDDYQADPGDSFLGT